MHPRDQYLTIFGRVPVREVLLDRTLDVARLWVDGAALGDGVRELRRLAQERKVSIETVDADRLHRISRNARQDQGVAIDVVAPRMEPLEQFLAGMKGSGAVRRQARLLALDGVTTPGNVGLVLRSAVALGVDGVVVPRVGCPEVGPLVVKASAGMAFRAPVLRTERIDEALQLLKRAGFKVFGFGGGEGAPLAGVDFGHRAVALLGNETVGIRPELRPMIDTWVRIPMASGVDSLNVACAATVVAYAWSQTPIARPQ